MRSIIFPLKANHGRERDPVCVLAVNIAAVDQINVDRTGSSRTGKAVVERSGNVRFGSKADMCSAQAD
ncbi:MAG: hypothetical protein WB041_06855, partial [Pseudolabrys sp.]